MTAELTKLSWPVQRLGEALEALARRNKLLLHPASVPTWPQHFEVDDDLALGRWIKATADRLNLEVEPVFSPYPELDQMILAGAPAFMRLRIEGEPRFLVLLRRGWRTITVLDPNLREHKVRPSLIASAVREKIEAPLAPELDLLLENVGVPRRKRRTARASILRERLSGIMIGGFWLVRLPPRGSFAQQLRHAGAVRYLGALTLAHATQYSLWLIAWFVIGRGALEGRLDYGWLVAWALLLLTIIPLRLFTTWMQGALAIRAGGLLKQRLLYGALRLEPEQIRHQGAGQLLGRIIETEAVESLALSGGFQGLLACIELAMAAVVLGIGAGGWAHAGLLLLWLGMMLFVAWRYFDRRRRWTRERMDITNDLVERMVGHRTRLAQEPRERWHETEDQSLEHYFGSSTAMDRTSVWLSVAPRGWLALGTLGLAPAFIRGGSSIAALAIGLGGMLLAYAALRRLAAGISQLADAAIAWQQVGLMFHGADAETSPGGGLTLPHDLTGEEKTGEVLLDARDLVFRHRDRTEPAIKRANLSIKSGDKLLIEGPSGGGKSTLASLLAGLRQPDAGLLLLKGFDRLTLGDENWRRLVASAPQFHENHVMTETFAFNLLMGRRWPARAADLEEGETVCRELGLGELIDRMPAGLQQMVGDTGWQLSHGERSRLFIARAILQHADLVLLDESFAALDPENLRRALTAVLKRTSTLVVIAHP
jgi:ABC-type multidrug transport system fused ATPase/permease subunit